MRNMMIVAGLAAAVAVLGAIYGRQDIADNLVPLPKPAEPAGGAPPVPKAERANSGKMAAFVYKSSLEPVPEFPFFDAEKATRTIADKKGKVVLLNLWATWCAPCREEMPSLDRLQKAMGSDKFEVVAVSVDKNGFDSAKKFLDGIGVSSLAYYIDPTGRAASQVKAIGMPATLLIDREGREIGRLMGPAEWDSADAKRLIEAALR